MLMQKLRGRIGSRLSGNSEAGFTLVELLVVMLILGILAAIAIPAFFNQKGKANDSKAKSVAHSAQVALETYSTDNNGSYVGATTTGAANSLDKIEPTLTGATMLLSNLSATGYTITITSSTGDKFEIVRNATTGAVTYPCTVPAGKDRGGCPANNFWN